MTQTDASMEQPHLGGHQQPIGLRAFAAPALARWPRLLLAAIVGIALGFAGSYLVAPVYSAQATFLSPQPQGGASAALASLGSLGGLAGGAVKSTADQLVGLMHSVTVRDRLIQHFDLMHVYGDALHDQARRDLAGRTLISIGKKDGLVTLAVEDTDPARAAAIANEYIEELRRMTNTLAISEAQRRRMFFEKQMQETKERLTAAQIALQASGFTLGALRSEPRAAAESYAALRAEATATEVKLQTLRESFADSAPEVRQELTKLQALQAQLRAQEGSNGVSPGAGPDYVGKYREFKYQETLLEMVSRQYELARVDESREGPLIQVIDPAQVPERMVRPHRLRIAAGGGVAAMLLVGLSIIFLARRRQNQRPA